MPELRARTAAPVARAVAVGAATALVLTSCSGGGGDKAAGGDQSSAASSPSPSSTVSLPAGVTLTAPGSSLSFGDSATVAYEQAPGRASVLKLTVLKAAQGSIKDFSGFVLDDPYKKQASYYYVDVSVKNVGEGTIGDVGVPLWGVNGDNTLLPAVAFTTTFPKCASKPLPKKFAPGDTLRTCLVYLSPDRGALDAVSYRPNQAFNPIRWTGDVAKPKPEKKPAKKGPAKHHKKKR